MHFFQRLSDYLKSTRLEVKNVNWPDRRETIRLTFLVIGVSAAVAAYLGLLDFIFTGLLRFIV